MITPTGRMYSEVPAAEAGVMYRMSNRNAPVPIPANAPSLFPTGAVTTKPANGRG